MKVKLRQIAAGPGVFHDADSFVDLPDEQAVHLIDLGQAEAIDPLPAEVATIRAKAAKTATLPAAK